MRPSQLIQARRAKILQLFARYPALSNIRICGSVARGEDKEDSDVDFLVDPGPGATLFDLGGLHEDLEELLGIPVDVISANSHMNTAIKNSHHR